MNTEFEAIFYDKADGTQPARVFLKSLDDDMRLKMGYIIYMLQCNGPDLREPYSKHLSDGIFELRAKRGSDITRVLYFFFVGKKIVITNGFIKKTDKTPPGEIATAKKYRVEYLNRKENK